MSQGFQNVAGALAVKDSRALLLERDETLRTSFSGTAFPSSPVDGQVCKRTDLNAFFQYDGTAWRRIAQLRDGALVFALVTDLRALDAAALVADGQRAVVRGLATAGDCPAIPVKWVAASTATHDGALVFRPTTGTAASGAGRWLREAANPSVAFTSGVATPSVANGEWFTTAGTTPITRFLDAFEGQRFAVVRGASDIVLTHDVAKINLRGANVTLTASAPVAEFKFVNGVAELISAAGSGKKVALNAEDYGCVHDGTTNDLTALQAAVDAGVAANGELVLPAGDYNIGSGTLSIAGPLSIRGRGRIVRSANPGTPAPTVHVTSAGDEVTIRDIAVHCSVGTDPATNGLLSAIRFEGCDYAHAENVTVTGKHYVGIVFEGVNVGRAIGCDVKGVRNRCFYAYLDCRDVVFDDCLADGAVTGTTPYCDYGFQANPGGTTQPKRLAFNNCVAKNCSFHGFSTAERYTSVTYTGCHADNIASGYGFLFETANTFRDVGASASACIATACQYGFYLNGCDLVTLSACQALSNTSHGIYANDAVRCNLVGCIAKSNAGDGIKFVGSTSGATTRCQVVACTSYSNTGRGLDIDGNCTGVRVVALHADTNTLGNFRKDGPGGDDYASAPNIAINPAIRYWQDGTSFALGVNVQLCDGWKGARSGGFTVSRQAGFNGAKYCVRVQRDAGNTSTGVCYILQAVDTELVRALNGRAFALACDMRVGANFSPPRVDFQVWNGTGEDETMDLSTGYATGWGTYSANGPTPTTTAKRYLWGPTPGSASISELGLGFKVDPVGTAGAADYFEFTNVDIYVVDDFAPFLRPFVPKQDNAVVHEMQKRLWKTCELDTTPAQNLGANTGELKWPAIVAGANPQRRADIRFPVRMFKVPSLTGLSPQAASAEAYDTHAGQPCTSTTFHGITRDGFAVLATGHSTTAVGNHILLHAKADARP